MDAECIICGLTAYMWFRRAETRCEIAFCKHHGEGQQAAVIRKGFYLVRDHRPLLVS